MKNSISPYVYSVIFGFLLYRIYDFMIKCSNDGILRAVPTVIFGAITTYIAYQQHKISSAQKDIAADKHRLAACRVGHFAADNAEADPAYAA
ncbi:hypothetical protein RI056_00135 (plasmid) [Komagataeibacter nataicola]|nr:hypothetical protein [Komagataeibacter nataicola]WNM07285.1 hypothetical protein RI056_00135 [Komagataeibacter nataicola]